MIFYMSSEQNQEKLDFLHDKYVFKKYIDTNLTYQHLMKIIKQDLRNTELQALIIDINIFKEEQAYQDNILEAFESFKLINPDSQVVVMIDERSRENPDWCTKAAQGMVVLLDFASDIEKRMLELLAKEKSESEGEGILEEDSESKEESIPEEKPKPEEESISEEEPESEGEDIPEKEPEPEGKSIPEEEPTSEEKSIPQEEPVPREEGIPEEKPVSEVNIFSKQKVKMTEGRPLLSQIVQNRESDKNTNVNTLNQFTKSQKQILIKSQWNCSNAMIAVVGTERRTGTTTAAFHMCEYLRRSGAKVSYTEANSHLHLRKIAEDSNSYMKEVSGHFIRNDIDYFENTQFNQDNGCNFIFLDLGNMQENTDWVYQVIKNAADQIILVAGGKCYEIQWVNQAIEILKGTGKQIVLYFNFLPVHEFEVIKEYYEQQEVTAVNGQYEPDLYKPCGEDIGDVFTRYKTS